MERTELLILFPQRISGKGPCVAACLISLLALAGCASPAIRSDQAATKYGFTRELIRGTRFQHVVYRSDVSQESGPLHVYLEGDGTPYVHKRWVSADPTPRNPLMLRLMALDPGPSIYLSRPCYNGLATMPPCRPELWTTARYSDEIVNSAVAVIRKLVSRRQTPAIFLFGHSGGGTLAMLMAARLPATHAVITLSGNLDTRAWTHYHDYAALDGSLNPADQPPLDRHILQLHLIGTNDDIVPTPLLVHAARKQSGAIVGIVTGFDHVCCWERIWPAILPATIEAIRPHVRMIRAGTSCVPVSDELVCGEFAAQTAAAKSDNPRQCICHR
jgi:hypothetical protein